MICILCVKGVVTHFMQVVTYFRNVSLLPGHIVVFCIIHIHVIIKNKYFKYNANVFEIFMKFIPNTGSVIRFSDNPVPIRLIALSGITLYLPYPPPLPLSNSGPVLYTLFLFLYPSDHFQKRSSQLTPFVLHSLSHFIAHLEV